MSLKKEDVVDLIKQTMTTAFQKEFEKIQEAQDANVAAFKKSITEIQESARSAIKEEKGLKLARFVRAMAFSKGGQTDAINYAIKNYGEEDPVTKALQSNDFAAGGALVQEDFVDEIIELRRARSVIRQAGPQSVPMPNGNLTLPKQTGGATSSYVGEGDDIPVSQPSTGDIKMTFRKLVCMVPVSNDLIRFGSNRGDTMIRNDIVRSIATREDKAFLRDDGSLDTPKGLYYWAPAANLLTQTGGATPTLAQVTSDLANMVLKLQEADAGMTNVHWIMAPRSHAFLMSIRDGNGNYVFRDELLQNRLWTFNVMVTNNVPINISGSQSEIYLVDFDDAVIGEADTLKIDASTEAAYLEGGTLKSAYSKDQTIIRAIEEHDFAMRHDSVVVLIAVQWAP